MRHRRIERKKPPRRELAPKRDLELESDHGARGRFSRGLTLPASDHQTGPHDHQNDAYSRRNFLVVVRCDSHVCVADANAMMFRMREWNYERNHSEYQDYDSNHHQSLHCNASMRRTDCELFFERIEMPAGTEWLLRNGTPAQEKGHALPFVPSVEIGKIRGRKPSLQSSSQTQPGCAARFLRGPWRSRAFDLPSRRCRRCRDESRVCLRRILSGTLRH